VLITKENHIYEEAYGIKKQPWEKEDKSPGYFFCGKKY